MRIACVYVAFVGTLLAWLLSGCGGKHGSSDMASGGSSKDIALQQVIEEILATPAPESVPPTLWGELSRELARILSARRISAVVAGPPLGERNRVLDLTLAGDSYSSRKLEWTSVNTGDYDFNSEVNIADLAPIGLHFGKTSAAADWDTAKAADGDGNGEVNIADIAPIGQNFLSNLAAYAVIGTDDAAGAWNDLGEVPYGASASGAPPRFEYPLTSVDYKLYRVLPKDTAGTPGIESIDVVTSGELQLTGTVVWDSGGPVTGAAIAINTLNQLDAISVATAADGTFDTLFTAWPLPNRIVVQAIYPDPLTGLVIKGFELTEEQIEPGAVSGIVITLPDPADKELAYDGYEAVSADGSVYITDLPAEVDRVFAQAYDPDASPEMFPGDYVDDWGYSLESGSFVWVVALDEAGQEVHEFDIPVELRFEIPKSQWGEILDDCDDPDTICIPIYSFEEETGQWTGEESGFVTDEAGTMLTEAELPAIADGTYAGRLYAMVQAGHFTFWNFDHPYYYVWRLGCMSPGERNTTEVRDILRLAAAMAKSPRGQAVIGGLLNVELADKSATDVGDVLSNAFSDQNGKLVPAKASCPIIQPGTLETGFSAPFFFMGIPDSPLKRMMLSYLAPGGRKDGPVINKEILVLMRTVANQLGQANAHNVASSDVLFQTSNQAVQIVHGNSNPTEIEQLKGRMENLTKLYQALSAIQKRNFERNMDVIKKTGLSVINPYKINLDPIPDWQILQAVDLNYWATAQPYPDDGSIVGESGLQLELSSEKSSFNLTEDVIINARLKNNGALPIDVLSEYLCIGFPIFFEVTDSSGNVMGLLDPISDWAFAPEAFTELTPGEEITLPCVIRAIIDSTKCRYNFYDPGSYTIRASYAGHLCPFDPVESNILTIELVNDAPPVVTGVEYLSCYAGATGEFAVTTELANQEGWEWDFGGGAEPDTSTEEKPTVAFGAMGTYDASVTVSNAFGSDTYDFTYYVYSPFGTLGWPQYGHDAQHTRRSPVIGAQTNTLKWRTHMDSSGGAPFDHSSPAIADDGTIYVGSDNSFYALNPDGTVKWNFNPTGQSFDASPAVVVTGTIYAGEQGGRFYALKPDGTVKWSYDLGDGPVLSPVIGDDGTIYVVNDNSFGNLTALKPDGSLKWTYPCDAERFPTPIDQDGNLFVLNSSEYIEAINPLGQRAWYSVEQFTYSDWFYAPAVGAGRELYFALTDRFWGLDSTGATIFEITSAGFNKPGPAIAEDGTIYFGATEAPAIHALSPAGIEQWNFPCGAGYEPTPAAIGADGTIYFGVEENTSTDGRFYALNPDGSVKWFYDTGTYGFDSSAVIGPDGTVYCHSKGDYLYAFGP